MVGLRTVERVAGVDGKTVVADVAAVAMQIVGPFPLVALEAQRLERPQAEGVPIAAMRRVVIGDAGGINPALGRARPAQRLDLELVRRPAPPALQPVPRSPGGELGRLTFGRNAPRGGNFGSPSQPGVATRV
jgi:hypothetical protein